eukprot:761704-Hanusia_phi.AAC.3
MAVQVGQRSRRHAAEGLQGIDVSTQTVHQQHEDPYLAIVVRRAYRLRSVVSICQVDPVRTMAAGKVEIARANCGTAASEYQTIPLDKIEDFGVHANQYYPVRWHVRANVTADVVHCFGINTGSARYRRLPWSQTETTRRDQSRTCRKRWIRSILCHPARRFSLRLTSIQAESQLNYSSRMAGYYMPGDKKSEESQVSKMCKDGTKIAIEQLQGLITQVNLRLVDGPRMSSGRLQRTNFSTCESREWT